MPKKAGVVFVITGAVLIISALLLYLYNQNEEAKADEYSQTVLLDIMAEITPPVNEQTESTSTETAPVESQDEPEETEPVSSEMTVVTIDGYDYIGYLSIHELGLELPVMSDWTYAQLQLCPCRHVGSTKTDDLVIAAHNYYNHFGQIKSLPIDSLVSFTDMDGYVTQYSVSKIETLPPTAVESVLHSDYDLILYTCTYGGRSRIAAFCNRVEKGKFWDNLIYQDE